MKKKLAAITAAIVLLLMLFAMAACNVGKATDRSDSAEASSTGTATGFAWTPTSDCTVCHSAEAKSATDEAALASKHTAAGKKCADCHVQADMEKAHKGVTAESSKPTPGSMKYPKELCLTCHGSYADLAAKTANSTALKDANDKVVNPHDLPKNAGHNADVDQCSNCHTIHSPSPAAGAYCQSCHHADVFECGTCHD